MITFEQFLNELRIKDKPSTFKDMILVKDRDHLVQLIADKADMRDLDVSEVKDMHRLFYKNKEFDNKNNWDISGWDTRKVTVMHGMFIGCELLESISLPHTDNVKGMTELFSKCSNLKHVSIPHMENVEAMQLVFYNCTKLISINMTLPEKNPVMSLMFHKCKNLFQDLSDWNITDRDYKQGGQWDIFKGCTKMFTKPDFFPKGYLK